MNILKAIIYGVFGGLLYGFASFYLLSSCLRENIGGIFYYGVQGLIYAVAYISIEKLGEKVKYKLTDKYTGAFYILVGACSGLISGSLNISIIYYNAILSFSGVILPELKNSIIIELLYFSLGCIILGGSLGYLIRNRQKCLA